MKKCAALIFPSALVFLTDCRGGGGAPGPPACMNTLTIACTQSGAVRGVHEGNLRAFRVILYAAPPVGNLLIIFGNLNNIAGPYRPSALELAFPKDIMGYWTRFAATGDPNGSGATQWLPYDATNENMLELDETFPPLTGYHVP